MDKRHRRPLLGNRAYKAYSKEMLEVAVDLVSRKEISSLEAEKRFHIPRRTIDNKVKNKHSRKPGGQQRLTETEEQNIVNVLRAAGDFGAPLSRFDLSLVVFNYLKGNNREHIFNNKPPGKWWIKKFLVRHKDKLTVRAAQNIKRVRAAKTSDEFNIYFDNLRNTLQDIPKSNILNYDETNLSDNPGSSKCIFKREVKYPERVLNHTKGNISIMFAAVADGTLLPTYTVFKAEHLWTSWCQNGPNDARYNRTKSGWFDATVFEDWFQKIIIPWAEKLEGPKLIIGDNLSSHLNINIIRLCEETNIRFAFLPPNSTHISQPLDVAFFGPLKKQWRKILTTYKQENPSETQLNKAHFPVLLKSLIQAIEITSKENIISGFRATGIVPFNPHKILRKLPDYEQETKYSIDNALLDYLKENRSVNPLRKIKNKKVNITPGASVSSEEIELLMSNKKSKTKKLTNKAILKEKREFEPETPPENEMTTTLLPSLGPETETYTCFASENETAASTSTPGPESTVISDGKKVTILSEIKYSPLNRAFYLDKSNLKLHKIDKTHNISLNPYNDKKLEISPEPSIDYNNPVPSTSAEMFHMPSACNRKRKLVQETEEETDESNDDYSLRDSSDEGPFFSESEASDVEEDSVQNNFEKIKNYDTLMHQIGSFLLVKFRGPKINKFYVGKLLELTEGSGMLVKFMRRKGDLFYWPDVNDISFIIDSDVELVLTNPQEGRRGKFKFDNIDFSKYNVQ